jgi:hypothetical protein
MNSRSSADLDDFLRLGMRLTGIALVAVMSQPSDLVLDGLLARLVGPLHDDLKALVILEQAGIEFGLDGATGRGTGKVWQADFL